MFAYLWVKGLVGVSIQGGIYPRKHLRRLCNDLITACEGEVITHVDLSAYCILDSHSQWGRAVRA